MMIPQKLKLGDTIGVVAPSDPIIGDKIEELEKAKNKVERAGFCVKYGKNLFSNTYGYSSTAKEKAEDINEMFQDKEVKMIWCATGGFNSNATFEYLDYELIKRNPKIICGYSDLTSITNMITAKTGLVTFHGSNFKNISKEESYKNYQEMLKRLLEGSLELGTVEEYICIQEGQAQGELVGGNLSLVTNMTSGSYQLDFTNKILFLEEFGLESPPALVNNYVLEKIIKDVLGKEYTFPMIQSNNFGHIETKIVIPIGTKAKIDTNKRQKIELIEQCVK